MRCNPVVGLFHGVQPDRAATEGQGIYLLLTRSLERYRDFWSERANSYLTDE